MSSSWHNQRSKFIKQMEFLAIFSFHAKVGVLIRIKKKSKNWNRHFSIDFKEYERFKLLPLILTFDQK